MAEHNENGNPDLQIKDVTRLRLLPGDLLVVTVGPSDFGPADLIAGDHLRTVLAERLGVDKCRIIIIAGSVELSVVATELSSVAVEGKHAGTTNG